MEEKSIETFNDLLDIMNEQGASDLHLLHNNPITLRIDKEIVKLPMYIEGRSILVLLDKAKVLSPSMMRDFHKTNSVDFAMEKDGVRYRGVLTRSMDDYTCTVRRLNDQILTMEELDLPEFIKEELNTIGGMILVTGPTGSGKTTTLNSIIHYLNQNKKLHITTVEDPIEYVHISDKSIVTQQEVGKDTPSFEVSMRSILRRDPDVILIGEMRDLESVSTACTAAETGHLVFGTLHTNTASSSIARITSIFPSIEQDSIRSQIAASLRIVINQRLLRKKGGGVVAAYEIMVIDEDMREAIRLNNLEKLENLMKERPENGNKSIDMAIGELEKKGIVDRDSGFK